MPPAGLSECSQELHSLHVFLLLFCFFYRLLFSPDTRIRIRLCHLDECMSDTLEPALMRMWCACDVSLSIPGPDTWTTTRDLFFSVTLDLMLPCTGHNVSIMMLILLTSSASLRQNLNIQPHSCLYGDIWITIFWKIVQISIHSGSMTDDSTGRLTTGSVLTIVHNEKIIISEHILIFP